MLKKTKTIRYVCLFLSIAILGSYTAAESQPDSSLPKTTLTIGLIPEQNIFKQIERYQPLVDYVATKIGIPIRLKVLVRYDNIINNFVSAQMDGAFFGSFTYCLAHTKLGVEAIARPVNDAGVSTYHGLIIVRKDSGIKRAQDMRGKRFAFVDKATTAGYLLPLLYFKENGINDYSTFLKETYFAGTHEDAIYDVLNRKAEIAAAKNTVFERLSETDDSIKKELMILKRSPDVPENGLAVKRNLDAAIKNKLKETLLGMHLDTKGEKILQRFGARKFIATTNDDYINVYEYTQKAGLDLATYDYLNK
ncbi:MAG: phosphate/phosphite/phosphonate ABC transporter substrate-binding protein [Desulfobacterales bacterium]|nr:phosphate/phosphite/phosphonate ABC transporter substrate-binding protein [Desulfobacterales bacterium]